MGILGNISGTGRFGGFLKINKRGIRSIATREGGDQNKRAVRDAVRDAVKEAGSKSLREYSVQKISEQTGLQPAIIRKRARVKVSLHRDRITVWFGLNTVNLSHMKPKQDAQGVTAGPARVAGGFIVSRLNGQVFVRKGLNRLPIKKQVYDIREKGRDAADEVYRHLLQSFETTMLRHVQAKLRTRGLLD